MPVSKKNNKQKEIPPGTKNPPYPILVMNKSWRKSKLTAWQKAEYQAKSEKKLFKKPLLRPD